MLLLLCLVTSIRSNLEGGFEIAFGYNTDDMISASEVLKDGYGQCNTKGTLFMALLRAVGIRCRIHGFTIDKKLQKGAMTGIVYKLAP